MPGMRRFYLKLNKELKRMVFFTPSVFYEVSFYVCEVHACASDML